MKIKKKTGAKIHKNFNLKVIMQNRVCPHQYPTSFTQHLRMLWKES
jgi:hypothetical protein